MKRHLRLRLSELPLYIGAAPKPGSIDFVPTPQKCDCEVTRTVVEGLFDLALCEKHEHLAPTQD